MGKYLVSYKCENTIVIEAENVNDAASKFWDPENFNYACESINEQPVEIEEIEEYDGDE